LVFIFHKNLKFYKNTRCKIAEKMKSKIPKKAAIPKDKPITIPVILIVSGIVGQFTRLSSCLDSCKNDEMR